MGSRTSHEWHSGNYRQTVPHHSNGNVRHLKPPHSSSRGFIRYERYNYKEISEALKISVTSFASGSVEFYDQMCYIYIFNAIEELA
jgi:hypothetical protein